MRISSWIPICPVVCIRISSAILRLGLALAGLILLALLFALSCFVADAVSLGLALLAFGAEAALFLLILNLRIAQALLGHFITLASGFGGRFGAAAFPVFQTAFAQLATLGIEG